MRNTNEALAVLLAMSDLVWDEHGYEMDAPSYFPAGSMRGTLWVRVSSISREEN